MSITFLPTTAREGIINISPSGDAGRDTTALNNAIALASASGGKLIIDMAPGNWIVRIAPDTVFTFRGLPVYRCVVLASNIHVRGYGAQIFIEAPQFTMADPNCHVFMFGTTHSTSNSVFTNITFEGMKFNFANTYGTVPAFTYAHGVISTDYFRRTSITYLCQANDKGRALFAMNCRSRRSNKLFFDRIIQAFYTVYDFYAIESDLTANRVTEFYDNDEFVRGMNVSDVYVLNSVEGDEIFDLTSAQNCVFSNLVFNNCGNIAYLYNKPRSGWTNYSDWWLHSQSTAPQVTIDIATGYVTWPSASYTPTPNAKFIFDTGSTLPTGFTTSAAYYVVGSSITGLSAQLSAAPDGVAIVTSGTQVGPHTGRYVPFTPEICKNVTFENVRGLNMREDGTSTFIVGTPRTDFERNNTSVQCENIYIRDWQLDLATRISVRECDNFVAEDIYMSNARPGTGAAISLLQSLDTVARIAESSLSASLTRIKIDSCDSGGISVASAYKCVMRDIEIDEYNTQGSASTNFGVLLSELGTKAGSYDIDQFNIFTSAQNCVDLKLSEYSSPTAYGLHVGKNMRLRTTSTGSVNVDARVPNAICDMDIMSLPSYNTTLGNVETDVLLHSNSHRYQVIKASIVTHDAITLAANNSDITLYKSAAGVLTQLNGATLGIDNASVAADTERTIPLTLSSAAHVATALISENESLVSEIATLTGTGSAALPKIKLKYAAIQFQRT